MRQPSSCLFVLFALACAAPGVEALELRGRLVDGSAMIQRGMEQIGPGGFKDGATRVPIASSAFRLTYSPAEGEPRSWSGKTDAGGRFSISLDGVGAGIELVASVTSGDLHAHFSMPVAVKPGEEVEFRLYNATASTSFLRLGKFAVYYSLVGEEGTKDLRVRLRLTVGNMSGEMFVGRKLEGDSLKSTRACFRVPLPGGPGDFKITRNEHDSGAAPFTITEDGWAILDSPIPPFPEAPRGTEFKLDYVTSASQQMIFAYPLEIPIQQFVVFGVKDQIALAAGPQRPNQPSLASTAGPFPDPDKPQETVEWTILHATQFPAGEAVPVIVTINSIELGQVNHRSLKVVCGFVLAGLIALLIGLMLGRGGPRIESVLSQASGEEIIERIAQLDAQYEKGRIESEDYESTRKRLLSLARYEVPELAGSGPAPKAGEAKASSAPSVSPEVVALAKRIETLETGSDPQKIQERVLLLEELAKAVRKGAESAGDAR